MTIRHKPDWRLVKVDWTEYLNEAFRAERGIASYAVYYLIDANTHIHICSFTPSLEAWPMHPEVLFDSEEAFERDGGETEIELFAAEEPVSYFGTEVLRGGNWRPASWWAHLPIQEDDEDDRSFTDRAADEVREYLCGNPVSW